MVGERLRYEGLTPAWAGTTMAVGLWCCMTGAHPRMGGDHVWPCSSMRITWGSPPHGRGPPHSSLPGVRSHGLTPAWAGTTGSSTLVLGESRGSPPHGRGPRPAAGLDLVELGLTPAWAGTTS